MTQARRYLRGLLAGLILPLLGIALLNVTVDPYRRWHAVDPANHYPRDPRRLVPGLIRTADYDAVIAGTSHCDNFLPSSLRRELGWNALRITLPGSTITQQRLAVKLALRTGRVRHVLWGLDRFAFDCPVASPFIEPGAFPIDYYRRSRRERLRELLSLDTAEQSVRVLLRRGDPDLETRGTWFRKYRFSESDALAKGRGQLAKLHRNQATALRMGRDEAEVAMHIRDQLKPLITAHPTVEFRLFLPPVSGLSYLADEFDTGRGLDERLRFRALLCQELATLPNVRLHDFELATEITHELANYMDLTHYGLPINDWMVERIAADDYRLIPERLETHQQRFATRTRALLAALQDPGHPFHQTLRLDRFVMREATAWTTTEAFPNQPSGTDEPVPEPPNLSIVERLARHATH
jgi:hypothetical protein